MGKAVFEQSSTFQNDTFGNEEKTKFHFALPQPNHQQTKTKFGVLFWKSQLSG
jgi:hypothetical protein